MVRGQRVRLQADLPDEHHLGGPVPAGAARARRRVPAGLPHTGDWPLRCAMRASGKFLWEGGVKILIFIIASNCFSHVAECEKSFQFILS